MMRVAIRIMITASPLFGMLDKINFLGIVRFHFTEDFLIRQTEEILFALGGFFGDLWTYLDIHFIASAQIIPILGKTSPTA
jgi:hypothetical protein